MMTSMRLYRSRADRMWAGVCGGIGHYFVVDPTIVRLFFVLATIFSGGLFALVYLVLWMVVPEEPIGFTTAPAGGAEGEAAGFGSPGEPTGSADPNAPFGSEGGFSFGGHRYLTDDERRRRGEWFGWALVILGGLFLVSNLHLLNFLQLHVTWPIFLIIAGALLLMRRRQQY